MIKNKLNPILMALEESDKNIMVVGKMGSGKTTMINDALEKDNDNFLVNGTLGTSEFIYIFDNNYFELYYICIIIKKVLLSIKNKDFKLYYDRFTFFEKYIDSLIRQIIIMEMVGIYKKETELVSNELYNNPELIYKNFIDLLEKENSLNKFTLVIDNFDNVGYSSQRFQKLIYGKIKKYTRLIISVSDENVINSKLYEAFSNENAIVKLNYNEDLEIVKQILQDELKKNSINNFVLDENIISMMIEKTNGNLNHMLTSIRVFHSHFSELSVDEYNQFILNYIDNEINKSPMLTGVVVPKRTLHITQKDNK